MKENLKKSILLTCKPGQKDESESTVVYATSPELISTE
jgi:hypothetical protein